VSLGVLLVEGWMAGSHEAWARGWQQRSRHRIGIVGQPGTHWQHRMVAGAVPLARETARHVDLHGTPDVVVATDMVDLPSWRGLCASMVRGGLAGVPTVLYLHENQMTQPPSPNGVADGRGRHLAWTNWRSLVAADAIWSNSRWQLDSVFESLVDLLGSSPDAEAQLPLLEAVRSRCSVQPVGCDLHDLLAVERMDQGRSDPGGPTASRDSASPPLVLWNHRWSHDKGLERAVTSLHTLATEGIDFELAIVGEDDHNDPARGERILAPVAERIVHRGWLEPKEYRRLLLRSDVVVACPRQENFGISVVEAAAAGCVPVVPDAFAYPETIDEGALRYAEGRLTTRLREVLVDLEGHRRLASPCRERLVRFDWPRVAAAYDSAIGALVQE
jgi:glycosyltransferase involved in cell wall biosynthesis